MFGSEFCHKQLELCNFENNHRTKKNRTIEECAKGDVSQMSWVTFPISENVPWELVARVLLDHNAQETGRTSSDVKSVYGYLSAVARRHKILFK